MSEEQIPFQTDHQLDDMRTIVAAHPEMAEWSVPTHYAAIEGTVLQVPERASSVHVGELSGKTSEGTVRPIQLPNTSGTLETWHKEGVGTDANGEERIALSNVNTREGATMLSAEYAKAAKASAVRKSLASAAMGTPESLPQVAALHQPYIPSEIEKRGPRPVNILVEKNSAQPAKTTEAIQTEQRQAAIDELNAELTALEAKYTDEDKRNLFFYATNMADAHTLEDNRLAEARMYEAATYEQRLSPAAQKDAQRFLTIWNNIHTLRNQK